MTAYLALGSNEGNRRENIERALAALDNLPATIVDKVSGMVESAAQGQWKEGESKGDFLNCCCRISTGLTPFRLLEEIKGIEAAMGRGGAGQWKEGTGTSGNRVYSDRPIDIDILLYGRRRIDEPLLQIPHPRMLERDFVMIPLRELGIGF